jgi:ABC-type nitrate/sulfonate/bicarbonate transport system ATPase subunit/metal-responsive CopG/Arc/MetJ family transcriptional regulator
VVFQRYSVFPHLTALRNVMFGLECAEAPFTARLFGARRRAAAAEAAACSPPWAWATACISSGADVGRDAAAAGHRAGADQAPRILLLDEPFGALDPGIRADMHALITQLWRDYSLTIIMVTHDIREAFALGTRVLALDKRRHRSARAAPLWRHRGLRPATEASSGSDERREYYLDQVSNNERPRQQQSLLANLARLSMSLAELFRQLDMMVEERGLPSRSQLIAELIRHALAEHEALTRPTRCSPARSRWSIAAIGRVRHQLAQTQADYLKEVISSQHVFLEDDQSLEVLLVQGPAVRLKALCDALRACAASSSSNWSPPPPAAAAVRTG